MSDGEFYKSLDQLIQDIQDNTPRELMPDPGPAVSRTLSLLRMMRHWSKAGMTIHPEAMTLCLDQAIGHLEPFAPPSFERASQVDQEGTP